jgi:hypothetical protein
VVARVLPHVTIPVVKSLTAAERAFLEHPYVGVVTDLRPDGSPHSTVVWVDVDDGGVSFNTAWPPKPEETRVSVRISPTWIESRGLE